MKTMHIYRMLNDRNIVLSARFMSNDIKDNTLIKAMLLEVAALNGHGDNLSFIGTGSDSVFFDFDKESMKMTYTSFERQNYMSILCQLQRYGQAHGCEVVIKTIS